MKKDTTDKIVAYLDKNCCCSPDTRGYHSTCGLKCKAKWHWKDEVKRTKLLFNLSK